MTSQNVKKEICGEFPESCYRAFKCEEHAEQFIYSGRFRMGCLLSYREIEDKPRRDPTEGRGHTKEPGTVPVGWVSPNPAEKTIWASEQGYQEHHSELGNAKFCLSTCLPVVDLPHMSSSFGRYIVEIKDPKQLGEDINDYFFSDGQRFLIEGCRVVYNKGQELDRKLKDYEGVDMSYKQKPFEFHPDCEFRIVAIQCGEPCNRECKYLDGEVVPKCKHIEIDIGKKDYLGWFV
jgi:hypothetical protein